MRDKESFVDSIVDVVVHRVLYDPLPLHNNRMMLALSTKGYRPKEYNLFLLSVSNFSVKTEVYKSGFERPDERCKVH